MEPLKVKLSRKCEIKYLHFEPYGSRVIESGTSPTQDQVQGWGPTPCAASSQRSSAAQWRPGPCGWCLQTPTCSSPLGWSAGMPPRRASPPRLSPTVPNPSLDSELPRLRPRRAAELPRSSVSPPRGLCQASRAETSSLLPVKKDIQQLV